MSVNTNLARDGDLTSVGRRPQGQVTCPTCATQRGTEASSSFKGIWCQYLKGETLRHNSYKNTRGPGLVFTSHQVSMASTSALLLR